MTGTSLDAVDVALLEIGDNNSVSLITASEYNIPDAMRQDILNISFGSQDSLHDIATLDHQLARVYAESVLSLLSNTNIIPRDIQAIGSHGQTVRHAPNETPPYTVQLGNGALLAELTGIKTVNDFRQADIAAGGQGAPLAPLFHHHLFHEQDQTVVGLNLGGIANISILHANGKISGFDTGPANTLMDQWIFNHHQVRYDHDAQWARSGSLNTPLLERLLSEPWLNIVPPKSTGPELFNLHWLDTHLLGKETSPEDVQRTLCEFSAITVSNAIKKHAASCSKVVLCGGGAYNPMLVERIQSHLPECTIVGSNVYGIDPKWIEASMFAWFAWRTLNGLPGNVPAVTGANHEAVLGAIHPNARQH
jgi:anhydro-N-acetylmuramic acid kinase